MPHALFAFFLDGSPVSFTKGMDTATGTRTRSARRRALRSIFADCLRAEDELDALEEEVLEEVALDAPEDATLRVVLEAPEAADEAPDTAEETAPVAEEITEDTAVARL